MYANKEFLGTHESIVRSPSNVPPGSAKRNATTVRAALLRGSRFTAPA
jgi:hypothetical protein